jgi:hypothetical protein
MAQKRGLFLSTKDIAVLHQVTERSARSIIQKIRISLDKPPYQPISLFEYCTYMQVDVSSVLQVLNDQQT